MNTYREIILKYIPNKLRLLEPFLCNFPCILFYFFFKQISHVNSVPQENVYCALLYSHLATATTCLSTREPPRDQTHSSRSTPAPRSSHLHGCYSLRTICKTHYSKPFRYTFTFMLYFIFFRFSQRLKTCSCRRPFGSVVPCWDKHPALSECFLLFYVQTLRLINTIELILENFLKEAKNLERYQQRQPK